MFEQHSVPVHRAFFASETEAEIDAVNRLRQELLQHPKLQHATEYEGAKVALECMKFFGPYTRLELDNRRFILYQDTPDVVKTVRITDGLQHGEYSITHMVRCDRNGSLGAVLVEPVG